MILTKFEISNTPTIFFKPVVALINFVAHLHTLDTVINNYHMLWPSQQKPWGIFIIFEYKMSAVTMVGTFDIFFNPDGYINSMFIISESGDAGRVPSFEFAVLDKYGPDEFVVNVFG